jgi:hypothetical protein
MTTEAEIRKKIDELKALRATLPPGDERSALNNEIGKLTGQAWKLRMEANK